MSEEENARALRRYVALDIHKHYCVVAGVNRDGQVLLQPVRVEHADLEGWLKKNLQATDHVVIESTTNAWHVYDLLEPLAERVVVANPIKVKQIATGAGENRYSGYVDPGAAVGGESGSGCVGAAGACSSNATVAFAKKAIGGDAYPDSEPDAQCGASSPSEA